MSDLDRNPLYTPGFWDLVDSRAAALVQRLARPVRGVLRGVQAAKPALAAVLEGRVGEVLQGLEVAQHFGFGSAPPSGVEAVAVAIGGDPDHRVIVAELDRTGARPELADGESVLYGAANVRVHCREDGSVLVATATATIEVTAAGMVLLGGGGAAVARLGDAVTITGVDSFGGAIVASGIISSGSATVSAG